MVRSKNKPKKNAAAVSPAAIPTGTTEIIAPVAATTDATAPNPTFTQIGMAGMIGMLSTVSSSGRDTIADTCVSDTPPTFPEPAVTGANGSTNGEVNGFAATNPLDAEQPAAAEEPKAEEPKKEQLADTAAEEPKADESKVAEPISAENTGIFAFFRRFYNSLGGAIHR